MFLIWIFLGIETPKYLYQTGDFEELRKSLQFISRMNFDKSSQEENNLLINSYINQLKILKAKED